MTEPSPSVVAEIEAFCERHQAGPQTVQAGGLRFLFDDPNIEEINVALDELTASRNGAAG
jgi:hypothetical protein